MSLTGFTGYVYGAVVFGVVLGMAGLLAAEFFHGLHFLLPVGGAIAMIAVGALTVLIGLHEPPADATSEH